ncbi:MAG: prephenate dehydrogenase/arogenate dehydrogenase family protein [Acidobacteria bacterium]|nr:prephenate dehydrogenase/arogenate dehydrogenase family protein [Acidobacteriota bacterium]
MKRVAIAGVGLIGGSFALALRQAGFDGEIVGVSSPRTIAEALSSGVIDSSMALDEAAAWADLLFLAQPIRRIVEMIPLIGASIGKHTLVTDAGSTKATICAEAGQHIPAAQFVGGHPMAGKETRGAASADPSLFRNRTWVLTRACDHPFVDWVRRIGAHVLILDAEEHDRTVAHTSHLPQLVSTALACTVDGVELQAGGPGLIDMTRLALSQYEMWEDILATNPEPIDAALREMIAALGAMREQLRGAGLREEFERAAKMRRRLVTPVQLR